MEVGIFLDNSTVNSPSASELTYKVSEVICVKCWTRWLAARPGSVHLSELECAGCGETGGVIETGEVLLFDQSESCC